MIKAPFDIDVKRGFALLVALTLCGYFAIINSIINKKLHRKRNMIKMDIL